MNEKTITRRNFLKTIGIGTFSAVSFSFTKNKTQTNKPNIILIMADDLGYEGLSCYGSTSYSTPVLDLIARSGIQFMHCYSQPLCTPSRVQIMTGQYNFRNYKKWGTLDLEQRTFAHVMKQGGYTTCLSGKWQLGGGVDGPSKAGFDDYCFWNLGSGFADIKGSRYANPTLYENGKILEGLEGKYGPDIFCDFILKFIEKNKDKPFFVYYPMVLVHTPFQPTPDSQMKSWNDPDSIKNSAKYFVDMVAYMDKIVGRITAGLDALGLRENTVLLFTGDNGTDRRITSKLGKVTIHGGKGNTTDAGTRVPFIANWKGQTPEGVISNDIIDFSDFFPTLADLGELILTEDIPVDGVSFAPQLHGQKGNPREWMFCSYNPKKSDFPDKEIRFSRDQRFKLYGDGRMFDISSDPLERHPITKKSEGKEAAKAKQKLQKALEIYK